MTGLLAHMSCETRASKWFQWSMAASPRGRTQRTRRIMWNLQVLQEAGSEIEDVAIIDLSNKRNRLPGLVCYVAARCP